MLKNISLKDRIFVGLMLLVAVIAILVGPMKVNAATGLAKPDALKSIGIVAYDGDKDGNITGSNDIYISSQDLYYLYYLAE